MKKATGLVEGGRINSPARFGSLKGHRSWWNGTRSTPSMARLSNASRGRPKRSSVRLNGRGNGRDGPEYTMDTLTIPLTPAVKACPQEVADASHLPAPQCALQLLEEEPQAQLSA